jgi:hypothetical protein
VHAPSPDPHTLPSWLPPPVRGHVLTVEKLLAGVESDLAILRRVATNPRMHYVWRELARHRTDNALVEFFDLAWQQARLPHFVTTPKDRAAAAAPWAQAAELCRWLNDPNNHQLAPRMNPELSKALARVADHFEEVARREGRLDSPLVVKHHNIDDTVRAYVRVLGAVTHKLFGASLYGTIARTASVALQREISWQQVRNWLKS